MQKLFNVHVIFTDDAEDGYANVVVEKDATHYIITNGMSRIELLFSDVRFIKITEVKQSVGKSENP